MVIPEQEGQISTYETLYLNDIAQKQPRDVPCNWQLWKRTEPVTQRLLSIKVNLDCVDQGWGNLKGAVDLKLCRGPVDMTCVNVNEWNQQGSGKGSHVVHRDIVAHAEHVRKTVTLRLDASSPFVANFMPGDYFELHYKVGGGGGHQLFVQNASLTFELAEV